MAKRPKRTPSTRGPCAYGCGKPGLEDEHVFPESWYPTTTPAHVEKLTVPACRSCNAQWHKFEDRLLFNLSVVLDHTPETAGIWDRQFRALRAESAKTPHDAKHRARRAAAFTRTMRWMPGLPARYSVPVRTQGGVILNAAPGRMIENRLWILIAEKFIRGLHCAETGQVLPKQLEVRADAGGQSRIEYMNDPAFHEELRALPLDRGVAPAPFIYGRVHFPEVSGWRFLLWRQIELFAFARPGVDPATVRPDAVAITRK